MTDVVKTPSWPAFASFVIPCAFALVAAGNEMGFYDSPELAAAGAGLAITHPPGHPLWVVIAALASLVPVGAVPFRIALVEALLLGAIGRAAYFVARQWVVHIATDDVSPRLIDLAALAAACTATLGIGVFRQATRVEVYALAGALAVACIALAAVREDASRRARVGVLLVGLGAANHHFIQLTVVPIVLWIIAQRWRERGRPTWHSVGAWAALFFIGVSTYVLLPIRAEAPASLPRPTTLGQVLDVASARVYAKNTGMSVPGTAPARVLEVIEWLGETLTPLGLLFALGGFYLALRSRRGRVGALQLLLVVLVVGAARAWLGFVRENPDAAGYLVPAMVVLGVATSGFLAGSQRALAEAPPPPVGPSRGARMLLSAMLLGGPLLLPFWLATRAWAASAVDRSDAPTTLQAATLSPVPPHGILFAYDPQSIFRLRYAMLVEGERPDVTVVPVPLLGYPGIPSELLHRDRALVPLLEQYLLRPDEELSPRLLSSLAAVRPVAMELDPRNIHANVPILLPRGLVADVTSEPTTLAAVRGAAVAHFAAMDQLGSRLAREPAARDLVNEVMLWHAYTDALFLAERGALPEARRAVARGLQIDSQSRELQELASALAPNDGPGVPAAPVQPSRR